MPFVLRRDNRARNYVDPLAHRDKEIMKDFVMPISMGGPLTDEILEAKPDPFLVELGDESSKIPSMWGGDSGHPWYVDDSVKSLLEELDPGVHGFIPINVRVVGGPPREHRFYILHCTAAIHAVVMKDTRFADGIGKFYPHSAQLSERGPIVLNGNMIEGRHLWRGGIGKWGGGGDPLSGYYFCSDQLADRLQRLKGTVRFIPCEVRQ